MPSHRPWKDYHNNLPGSHHKRRFLFGRFFGFMLLLVIPFIAAGALSGIFFERGDFMHMLHPSARLWFCGVPLLLPILAILIGARVFRNMSNPFANIMAAADTLADGDLSVRVSEHGPSEMQRMARAFNRMAEELERAENQRRNLTADVAHELRTPLHIIQGNLEGVIDGVYPPTPEHFEAMLDETRLLARLVDDLQTLSLAEAGQLPLHLGAVDLVELLQDVCTSFSGQAEQAGVALTMEVAGDEDKLKILGDGDRLDQVFSNLVGNALRFTSSGGRVILNAAATPEGARVSVRDSGAGIPPEDIPYIFERFWKGDRARSRGKGGGSGLGLAITQQLVQAHGGQICVESELNQGSVFSVFLPHG